MLTRQSLGSDQRERGAFEMPPPPPSDWRLNVKLFRFSPYCRGLQAFENDPGLRIHRFRVNKSAAAIFTMWSTGISPNDARGTLGEGRRS